VGSIRGRVAADPAARLCRHCAASIAHAAGAITSDLYTSVFEDPAADLAEQMSRLVPRTRPVTGG